MPTLAEINAADQPTLVTLLHGTYEHSPWIAERAWPRRPVGGYTTLDALKLALVAVVASASRDEQIALVRAHPELAGKAMVSQTLTAESTHEQGKAGLTDCTPGEFAHIQQLNAAYNARFGWPFILAVRGARGAGLDRHQIIATFERRLAGQPDWELAECLRNIHRIAEIRLGDAFSVTPEQGNQVWDWAEQLAAHSDPGYAERGELTVTYLTDAHRACAAQLVAWMQHDCGFDEVGIDAVGNVVGVYHGATADGRVDPQAPRLLTGSHYDTVRNGGKYDGRLGILVPMAVVARLRRSGRRLPFALEVVGFAEEEGQRYPATFLGSGALIGQFDPAWLSQVDADGVPLLAALTAAGLDIGAVAALRRDPARYLGFVEVHIEQGPVLTELGLPLGVVSSINGSVRFLGEFVGVASHAGTTPMGRRRDAAAAAAELALYVERRAALPFAVGDPGDAGEAGTVGDVGDASEPAVCVGTVGQLDVPNGSINVVPGRCRFSLDLRATSNAARDALAADVLAELGAIARRRGLHFSVHETMRASAAPSAPAWRRRWEAAVAGLGLPVYSLPSGAGHDAMKLHELLPQAMLFVRGYNDGISHNPLEEVSNHDADLAVRAFTRLLDAVADEHATSGAH